MRIVCTLVGVIAIWLITIGRTPATMVTDNAPLDNQLGARDSVSPAPTIYRNNGTSTLMTIGGVSTNNDYAVSIMRWTLASVPAGEVAIADGNLKLTRSTSGVPSNNLNGTQIFEVYKIKAANAGWAEGTGNVAGSNPVTANNGGSTWSNLSYNSDSGLAISWNGGFGLGMEGTGGYEGVTAGSATPISTFTFDNGGSTTGGPTTVNISIPKDVINGWIANPATNAGLYIKLRTSQLESTEHLIVFKTKNVNAASAPTLTFETALPSMPGDFDSDGDVDGADFVAWQTHFPLATGAVLADGDADGDGDVDGADFVAWQTQFPFTPGPAVAPVPEPQAVALVVCGVFSLGCLRRTAAARRSAVG